MITDTLLTELQNLSRADKWQIVQTLMNDLANEELLLLKAGSEYEIWSPFDAPQAAGLLEKMLTDEQE